MTPYLLCHSRCVLDEALPSSYHVLAFLMDTSVLHYPFFGSAAIADLTEGPHLWKLLRRSQDSASSKRRCAGRQSKSWYLLLDIPSCRHCLGIVAIVAACFLQEKRAAAEESARKLAEEEAAEKAVRERRSKMKQQSPAGYLHTEVNSNLASDFQSNSLTC